MKIKNLSVINAVPIQYAEIIDYLAECYGCGANSLSRKLTDKDGNIYRACHSFWNVQDYAEFTSDQLRAQFIAGLENSELINQALKSLLERCVLNGDPQQNTSEALSEWGFEYADVE